MEYDIFEGTPQGKWLEIIYHASPTLARAELLALLERLALLELALERHGIEESALESLAQESKEVIQSRLGSLAIESMGRILSQNE